MKHFTTADVDRSGSLPRLNIDYPADLALRQLWWQAMGLQFSESGYGSRIPSDYMLSFNGKLYRIYHTVYSNASSAWIKSGGEKIFIS